MKTPEFWRRLTQALPEVLLDSSALGKPVNRLERRRLSGIEPFCISF